MPLEMRVIQNKIHLNPSKDSLKKFNSPVTEKPSAVENSRLPLNEFPFTVQGSGDFQSLSARLPRANLQASRYACRKKGEGKENFCPEECRSVPLWKSGDKALRIKKNSDWQGACYEKRNRSAAAKPPTGSGGMDSWSAASLRGFCIRSAVKSCFPFIFVRSHSVFFSCRKGRRRS